MSENYSFPPYEEKLSPLLDKFGGTKMETYRGDDIRPLWDMSGGAMTSSHKYLYSAPKLEKIVLGIQCYREKLMTYTISIWPDDKHALPIFSSFWAESAKGSYIIADYYPIADCICDLPYLEYYYEPLDDMYEKALKYFPKKVPRDPAWFRALCSPYYITADFSPSTKETQDQVIEVTADYLEQYHALWEKDEPKDEEYMKVLNSRKQSLRDNLIEKDPGVYMLHKAVGEELANLTVKALF